MTPMKMHLKLNALSCGHLIVMIGDDGEIGGPVEHTPHFATTISSLYLPNKRPLEFVFFVQEFASLFSAEAVALKRYCDLAAKLQA